MLVQEFPYSVLAAMILDILLRTLFREFLLIKAF